MIDPKHRKKVPGGVRILSPRVKELQMEVADLKDRVSALEHLHSKLSDLLSERGIILRRI